MEQVSPDLFDEKLMGVNNKRLRVIIKDSHSYLKASMGLSFPAFSAGYMPASNPTIVQIIIP